MTRFFPLLLLCLALAASGRLAVAAVTETTIAGGNLPHAIRVAPSDEDAFFRRIDLPPKLDEAPTTSETSYRVTSPYWDLAVRNNRADRAPAEDDASYWPEGGYVRARQSGKDVWLVLDVRQQAILGRYIRLTVAGALGEEPGVLEVLAAAAKDEVITVSVGNRDLTTAEASSFWTVARGQKPLDRPRPSGAQPPRDGPNSVWVVFGLPEGRTVQLLYMVASDTLTDSLGVEVYGVPRGWLAPVLGAEAPQPGGSASVRGGEVAQQAGRGSPFWWVIMLGGGALCLAVALYLRRHPSLLRWVPFLGE